MKQDGSGVLRPHQIQSIRALIAYVSYHQRASEETVKAVLTTAFGVDEVRGLPPQRYDEAVQYLVDLRLSEIIN